MRVSFEDIVVGAEYCSEGRTITEADIVNFAGLSGDFNPLHMDDAWVRENTNYTTRIAHGLLIHAIGEGLRCYEIERWHILAFLETQRAMVVPVVPGDRVIQTYRVDEKKPSSKDPSRGVIEVTISVQNQDGEVVQWGYNKYLVGGG